MFACWVDEPISLILMSCLGLFFSLFLFCLSVSASLWLCDTQNLTPNTFLRTHTSFPETSAQPAVASHLCSVASSACCSSVSFIPSTESQLFSLLWNAVQKMCQCCTSPGILEGFPHSAYLLQILQLLCFSFFVRLFSFIFFLFIYFFWPKHITGIEMNPPSLLFLLLLVPLLVLLLYFPLCPKKNHT